MLRSAGRRRDHRDHGVRQVRPRRARPCPVRRRVRRLAQLALSFCAIQFVHGTLATKQPAMTAATLAAKLKHERHRGRLRGFVDEVANLTRSQVAAIAGNLALVIPAALLVEIVWELAGGGKLPSPEKAKATIDSLNIAGATPPLRRIHRRVASGCRRCSRAGSGIGPYAARLPKRSLTSRGSSMHSARPRCRRPGAGSSATLPGWAATSRSGFLLGMTPVVATFFGLPLDVRHVTLSTGSLGPFGHRASDDRIRRRGVPARLCGNRARRRAQPERVLRACPLSRDPRHGAGAVAAEGLSRRAGPALRSPRDFLLPPRTVHRAAMLRGRTLSCPLRA